MRHLSADLSITCRQTPESQFKTDSSGFDLLVYTCLPRRLFFDAQRKIRSRAGAASTQRALDTMIDTAYFRANYVHHSVKACRGLY
jgi:hypothetical protein